MRIQLALLSGIFAVLCGCAGLANPGVDAADAVAPPFPECRADSYAFAGRGTFAALGLVGQSAAALPDPNRPASIWVTRDPVPFDVAAPGGSRMLCFEFDDGSGGSEWPVSAAWQPPAVSADASGEPTMGLPLLLVAVLAMLVVGAFAFRRP